MNRSSSLKKQKTSRNLTSQSAEINFNQCCVFENPQQWRIIGKANSKNSKTFLKLTIGSKKSQEETIKHLQSKQTRSRTISRSLSSQSSKQVFEQAKSDFMEQLKMFKGQSKNLNHQFSQNQEREVFREEQLSSHEIEDLDLYFDFQIGNQCGINEISGKVQQPQRFNRKSHGRWMHGELESIKEVETGLQATQGLNSQNTSFVLDYQYY